MRALFFSLLILAIQTPPRSGVIEGYVFRAGTEPPMPLVNARLELKTGSDEIIARTDSSGKFSYSGLRAGRYRLRVTKDGFLRQEYPRASMDAPGLPIDLSEGQEIRNVAFRLDPAPTISGVIRDVGNAPIANVVVQALRRGYDARGRRTLSLAASSKTDDRGAYRLYWLDTGEYFIAAIPPPPPRVATNGGRAPTALATTYFPGFASLDDAKPIRLESSRDANGLDFALTEQPVGPVRGAVTSMTKGGYAVGAVSLVAAEDGAGVARYQTRSVIPAPPERNNYSIPAVSPGAYILTAISGEERASRRILVRGGGLLSDLQLGPGIAIHGRLEIASGSADLRATRIRVTEEDPALPEPSEGSVAADGTFEIPAVQPGRYSFGVTGLPGDLYVRTASYTGVNAIDRPLSVAYSQSGSLGELSIQIATDGGRIAGTVLDRDGVVFPAAQVTLIPEGDARLRPDLYRMAVSGLDGTFTMRGIVPGNYKIFGWDNLEPNAHMNSEFIRFYEDLGTPVHIEPNQSGRASIGVIHLD